MTTAKGAWTGFWRDEPAAVGGATLANLPPVLQELLNSPWHDLAQSLPPKARVLDLATGGGFVLELLRRQRRDFNLFGVDAALDLPNRPGISLKGAVSTERLPFADGRFDAITSRFGIEYGNLESGASEAGRVMKPGGRICLVLHHDKSNIVRHNRARSEALHWAVRESGWVEKAYSVVRARRTLNMPTPLGFGTAPNDGANRFPGQPVAWEFLTGLKQLLDAGATERQIADLRDRAHSELARLSSLLKAACGDDRLACLTRGLTGAGIVIAPCQTIHGPDGTPIAWHVKGRKT